MPAVAQGNALLAVDITFDLPSLLGRQSWAAVDREVGKRHDWRTVDLVFDVPSLSVSQS